jgi:hypothetical protein
MHDRQEIFGELLLGRGALVTENHELDALALEDPADEFETESAESIAVGNAHFLYVSTKRSFQNGAKAFSLEVEARADISNDFVAGALILHEGDLPLEVIFLLCGGNAAIGDLSLSSFGRFCGRAVSSGNGFDVVESYPARGANEFDEASIGPAPESITMDVENLLSSVGFYPRHDTIEWCSCGGAESDK